MGVQGLWSILQCTGKDIDLSALQGKVLAIDISIWLNQALKSNVDIPSPHLQLIFRRVCKLLYYKIKPVFVFDGPTPQIKKLALDNRRQIRRLRRDKTEQIKTNILNLLMKKNLVKKDVKLPMVKRRSTEKVVTLFDLPPEENLDKPKNKVPIIDQEDYVTFAQEYVENFKSISDININDDYFLCLPLEVQHEVIGLLEKEKRYGNNCTSTQFEDKNLLDFSNFQIERMLNITKLQQRKKQLRLGMNERDVSSLLSNTFDYNDGKDQMQSTMSDIIKNRGGGTIVEAKKVMSSDNKNGYLLMIDQQDLERYEIDNMDRNASNWRDDAEKAEYRKSVQSSISKKSNVQAMYDDSNLEEKTNEPSEELNMDDISKIMLCASKLTKNTNHYKSILNTSGDIDSSAELGSSKLNDSLEEPCTKSSVEIVRNEDDKLNKSKDLDSMVDVNDESEKQAQPTNASPASLDEWENTADKSNIKKDEKGFTASLEAVSDEDVSDDDFVDVEDVDDDFVDVEDADDDSMGVENADDDTDKEKEMEPEKPVNDKPESSSTLRNYFSGNELDQVASDFSRWEDDLDFKLAEYEKEEMKLDKQAMTVTEIYLQEAKDLLRLFGIPYVESPGEAEAQCAWLETHGLVDGTITEDSDVWLFGGQTVYKHVFALNMTPRMFTSSRINRKLGLTRDLMVCIALLSGSDYTAGIYGVGPVIAMEILADFTDVNTCGDSTTLEQGHMKVLEEFKKWHRKYSDRKNRQTVNSHKKRYLKLELNEKFPDQNVFNAYDNPLVDESEEQFQWGKINNTELVEFAENRFSWPRIKTIEVLQEVLEKSEQKKKIFDYFSFVRNADTKQKAESSFINEFLSNRKQASKRLINAVQTQKLHISPNKKAKKN